MMRSRRRVAVLIFLTVLLSWLLRCGMQEEIFDLAEGSDVIIAIGYDTTTKIISLEPELDNFKVYDTGIAITPNPGGIAHDHRKTLWFVIGVELYSWNLSDSGTPIMRYASATPVTFGVSDEGNAYFQNGADLNSVNDTGATFMVTLPGASTVFYQNLFFRDGSGGFLLNQGDDDIYSISSGSAVLYASTTYSPLIAGGNLCFLTRRNGEFFAGLSIGDLYRDFGTNGTVFTRFISGLTVGNANGVSFLVVSSSIQYVAYQSAANADVVILRYENGIPSTIVSIPTTGEAHVFLRQYKDDRLILGVGYTASAQGLYLVDCGNKSYTLINTLNIYGLSRADE